jgi:thiol:disulfide interchange protein DsbC
LPGVIAGQTFAGISMTLRFALAVLMLLPVAARTEAPSATSRLALLATVPPESRIVIPAAGQKLAQVVVFTDTDCPYCMKLHDMRDAIAQRGIEIQYLFYPRSGPGGDSYAQAVAVWCSADRVAALEKVLHGETLPATHCDNPVDAHYELAQKLNLRGTPAIVTPEGAVGYGVPGHDGPVATKVLPLSSD